MPATLQDNLAQSAGLPAIVQMLSVPDAETRCSAIWALANLIHAASPAVCKAVMAELPWDRFASLLQDDDSSVQVSFISFCNTLCIRLTCRVICVIRLNPLVYTLSSCSAMVKYVHVQVAVVAVRIAATAALMLCKHV